MSKRWKPAIACSGNLIGYQTLLCEATVHTIAQLCYFHMWQDYIRLVAKESGISVSRLYSGSPTIRTGSVHKAVAASVAFAFLIVVFVLVQKNSTAGIAALREQNRQELALFAQEKAHELLNSVSSTDKDRTDDEIGKFVAQHSPARLNAIIAYLRSDNTPPETRFMAVEVAEKAGRRYKNSNLLLAAVSEYISGRNVQKDFVHAKGLLDTPFLQEDVRTDYYLGLWWSDKSNKDMDVATARKYFKKAADAGFAPALKALEKI